MMVETIGQILPRAAARFGDDRALVCGEREFSFRELDELSAKLASGLAQLGIGPGDIVTIYSANRWEWVVSYYGVLKLGAVANPINVMLTPAEVEFVVTDCGARAVLASGEKGVPVLGVRERSDVAEIVLFDEDAVVAGARSFEDVLASGSSDFVPAAVEPDRLSTICYTSGTTGHPKGAMQSHRSVVLNAAMTALMHVRTPGDVVVTALPCPHVYGNVVMNAAMMYGMTLVLHAAFVESEVLGSIERHRATMFEGVPTMYLYLLNHPDLETTDLSSLTRCTVGGQTMAVGKMREVEERFGCPLLELWGMTEIAGLGTTHPLYGPNRHGSIGIPLPLTEARIADVEDAGVTLPAGEVGELMMRGPIVMQGYHGNERATSETIEPDGWLHTGDLARMDEDGYVYVVDRKKDMILTAGYNVYPAEIERVLGVHPAVAMVAVGPLRDEAKGELAKAYVVVKPDATATEAELIAFCRSELAAYKVPRAVQFVDDLPKTSTGKIMRRELRTLDQ
jgi:long-chain acyl-CoA synthetase